MVGSVLVDNPGSVHSTFIKLQLLRLRLRLIYARLGQCFVLVYTKLRVTLMMIICCEWWKEKTLLFSSSDSFTAAT